MSRPATVITFLLAIPIALASAVVCLLRGMDTVFAADALPPGSTAFDTDLFRRMALAGLIVALIALIGVVFMTAASFMREPLPWPAAIVIMVMATLAWAAPLLGAVPAIPAVTNAAARLLASGLWIAWLIALTAARISRNREGKARG